MPNVRLMFDASTLPARVGERPPPCYGMSPDRTFYSFEEQYGRNAVLILAGAKSELQPVVAGIIPHLNAFVSRATDVLILVAENPARLFGGLLASVPIRTIDCGNFLSRCGVGPNDTLVLVLDRNLRIGLRLSPEPGLNVADACLACLDALPSERCAVCRDAGADHRVAEPAAPRAMPPSDPTF